MIVFIFKVFLILVVLAILYLLFFTIYISYKYSLKRLILHTDIYSEIIFDRLNKHLFDFESFLKDKELFKLSYGKNMKNLLNKELNYITEILDCFDYFKDSHEDLFKGISNDKFRLSSINSLRDKKNKLEKQLKN